MSRNPGMKCCLCGEYQENPCNSLQGFCQAATDATKDAGYPVMGLSKVPYNGDASECRDFNISEKGLRELQYLGAEAGHRDSIGQPADPVQWARQAGGGHGLR